MGRQKTLRIGIVGAGPGGLTLARILQVYGFQATVFEADSHAQQAPQRGTLELHLDGGQLALHCAGLDAEWARIARADEHTTRLCDSAGQLLFEGTTSPAQGQLQVEHAALRQLLLDALPPGTVRWGHRLDKLVAHGDGSTTLLFGNQQQAVFDLVVGADGAHSKLRPMLSSAVPVYSGVTVVELGLDNVDQQHPGLAALVGHGGLTALGGRKALVAQRNGQQHIHVYAALHLPERRVPQGGVDLGSHHAVRASLLEQFAGWAPELLGLLQRCGDAVAVRPIYALPIGHRWMARTGFTLLGDAAHLMSPLWGGHGVNHAMLDATDLARLLVDEPDWRSAVRLFEIDMFERARKDAATAAQRLVRTLSDTGLDSLLRELQARHSGADAATGAAAAPRVLATAD